MHCTHALRACPARMHCAHALRGCTARMHCAYALRACTARMHCTHALRACTARMHCTHALHPCTTRMHCTHALHACPTPMHCTQALRACTARIHYTHALHACTARMQYTRALHACTTRMPYTHALHASTAHMHTTPTCTQTAPPARQCARSRLPVRRLRRGSDRRWLDRARAVSGRGGGAGRVRGSSGGCLTSPLIISPNLVRPRRCPSSCRSGWRPRCWAAASGRSGLTRRRSTRSRWPTPVRATCPGMCPRRERGAGARRRGARREIWERVLGGAASGSCAGAFSSGCCWRPGAAGADAGLSVAQGKTCASS